MRAKIEASGRDARWEFDRKRLFERTDYMATICQDIYDVAQVSFSFTRYKLTNFLFKGVFSGFSNLLLRHDFVDTNKNKFISKISVDYNFVFIS